MPLYLIAQRWEDPNRGFLFSKLKTFWNICMILPITVVKLKGIFKIINSIIQTLIIGSKGEIKLSLYIVYRKYYI